MSEKSSSGHQKSACKRPFSSFKNDTVDKDFEADNIFGFMDDSDVCPKEKTSNVPVHDLQKTQHISWNLDLVMDLFGMKKFYW